MEDFFEEVESFWVGLLWAGAKGVSMDLFELGNGGALG